MTESESSFNPLSTKRLTDTEAETPILETENTKLKAQIAEFEAKIAVLETKNAMLKFKLQKMETDLNIIEYICPKCHLLRGKFISDQSSYGDKQFSFIRSIFECENCHNKYERTRQAY